MSFASSFSKTPFFRGMKRLEDQLAARNDVIHPSDQSPTRFEIMQETIRRNKGGPPIRMLSMILPTLRGIRKSIKSLARNPRNPKIKTSDRLWDELQEFAQSLGVSSLATTPVPNRWVFQNKAIAYPNAIILTMEMDKDGIDSAPSLACLKTVMETYRDLGQIGNQLAEYLRSRGYGAHAGHPLMGLALYPPLAQNAGLGWMGLNGLLITPEHGPRVRLAAVFTSITNFPIRKTNQHAWVGKYCQSCRICINKCPPKAFYESPIFHDNGQVTYIDNERCFPYFSDYYGCSVCVSVCPFNHLPYQTIRSQFLKKKYQESIIAEDPI